MRKLLMLLLMTVGSIAQPLSLHDPAFSQSTSILRQSLFGYWRFEEASSTRYDCSNQGTHLTANNSAGSTSGKVGNGLNLISASNQSVSGSTSNAVQLLAGDPFTYFAWVKLTNTGTFQVLTEKNPGTPNRGYSIYLSAGQVRVELVSDGSNYFRVTGSTVITNAAWHAIAITYDGSKVTNGISIYVDNVIEPLPDAGRFTTGTVTDINNTGTIYIGARGPGSLGCSGIIDELGIWRKKLPTTGPGSLTQLYNLGLGTHFPWAHP